MLGSVAIGTVVVQLAATAVLQAFQRNRWVVRLDRAAIVPMWMFFAVDGAGEGWQLHARDGFGDVSLGAWRRIALAPPRSRLRPLWNPHRHLEIQTLMLLERLARRNAREPGFDPADSRAYAALLALVRRGDADTVGATSRQFAITRVGDATSAAPRFTSRFHPLS